jgi:hypothetical protein
MKTSQFFIQSIEQNEVIWIIIAEIPGYRVNK